MNSPNMKLEVKGILSKIAFIGKSFDNRLEVRLVIETYCPACGSKPEVRHGSPIQEGELIQI